MCSSASWSNNVEARGRLLQRLELDRRAQRELGAVRSFAAGLVAVAGSWLLVVATHWIHTLFGAFALLAALGYTVAAGRHARRRRDAGQWHLALYENGLLLAEGERHAWVPWTQVREVEVDEERLQLCVERGNAPPLRIEPVYAGVDLPGLERRVRDAWLERGSHRE